MEKVGVAVRSHALLLTGRYHSEVVPFFLLHFSPLLVHSHCYISMLLFLLFKKKKIPWILVLPLPPSHFFIAQMQNSSKNCLHLLSVTSLFPLALEFPPHSHPHHWTETTFCKDTNAPRAVRSNGQSSIFTTSALSAASDSDMYPPCQKLLEHHTLLVLSLAVWGELCPSNARPLYQDWGI